MHKLEHAVQTGRHWGLFVGAVAILGLVWIWLSAMPVAGNALTESPRPDFLAPDFTLVNLEGESVTLSDLRGKVVMVNLWASWCPPCRAEMPAIEAVYQANKDKGLEVLAVNTTYQDSPNGAAQFASEYNLTFPILLDLDGAVSKRYQLRALPTTFFIDKQGVISAVVPGGPMSESLIQSKIADLLAEEF